MDDFDFLSQPTPTATQAPETVNTNAPVDDLFGGNDLSAAAPAATFVNDAQEDLSWAIENDVPSAAPTHSDMFGENTLNQLATASVDDGLLTNQSSVNETDSFSTNDLASPIEETMSNSQAAQQTGTPLYGGFSSSVPAASTNNDQSSYADVSFTTTQSPMEAFNARRQQQLAEKDAEEKRKIDEMRQQGKADLERWYQDRRTSMEQNRQSMKNEEEAFRSNALEKSDSQSCDWSKVVRLIDFTSGQQVSKGKRDVNRMKSVLLHASRQKAAAAVKNGS